MKTLLISAATPTHHSELTTLVNDFSTYSSLNKDMQLSPIFADDDGISGRSVKTDFANLIALNEFTGNVWWIDSDFRIGNKIDLPEVKPGEIWATAFMSKTKTMRVAPSANFDEYLPFLQIGQHFQHTGLIGFASLDEAKAFCQVWHEQFSDGLDSWNNKLSDEPSFWKTVGLLQKTTCDLKQKKFFDHKLPVPGLFHNFSGAYETPSNFFTSVPEVIVPIKSVPAELPQWRIRAILQSYGLLDSVETAIANLTSPEGEIIKIAWTHGAPIARYSNAIESLSVSLGLSNEEIDDMFIAASQITI